MRKFLRIIDKFEEYVVVVLFVILILLCFLQVLFRFAFNFSLSWTEELSRFVFIFLVWIAAALAVKRDRHVRVEIIDLFVSKRVLGYIMTGVDIVWFSFIALVGVNAIDVAKEAMEIGQTSPALQAPMGLVYMMIPFSLFLMCIRIVERIYRRFVGKGE